jgi:hypothetical protein
MECEYGDDVACCAKNLLKIIVLALHSALFYYRSYQILYTSSIQCEISATTLRKT